jgi:hypothetical protein
MRAALALRVGFMRFAYFVIPGMIKEDESTDP